MQVIPVIDLMQGQVVRGVGGRRSEYRPIESILCADARPRTVARALATCGFRSAYVADLDAIEKGDAAHFSAEKELRPLYSQMMAEGLELWVDAGVRDAEGARELTNFQAQGRGLAAIVAGLEALEGPRALAEITAAIGPERLIFSLDLKNGVPLAREPQWSGLSPRAIAVLALRAGVRRMIVLDLAAVGMGGGAGTEPLCRELRTLDPELEIIAGGGVRGFRDLKLLERAGCDAALVASALHDGRLDAHRCASGQWSVASGQ